MLGTDNLYLCSMLLTLLVGHFLIVGHIMAIMCQNMKFSGRITRQLCSKMLGEKEILAVPILMPEISSAHT